jgi:hypothetical protein
MLLERSAYLSPQDDISALELALERIWLDWKKQQLADPKCLPVGVDQAVYRILAQVSESLSIGKHKKD